MKIKDQTETGKIESSKQLQMPSIDFRMQTSRLMVELQEFKKSVKILDSIIQEEDSHVETWYLLAFCLCKLKKFKNAEECITNVQELIQKQKIKDQEFLTAADEIEETIKKGLAKQPNQTNDQQMQDGGQEEGDDGYETYSEEDVSDEDAEMN